MNVRTLSPGRSAPADLEKDANGFDRPIALGLLLASGQVAFDRPGNFAIVGELALTGETRPIKGILAMALQAVSEARDGLLVPTANAAEAAIVEGLNVYPVGSLDRGRRLPHRAGREGKGDVTDIDRFERRRSSRTCT